MATPSRTWHLFAASLLAVTMGATPSRTADLEPVTIGTSRPAGPEQGGYYQAIADGSYRKYGLAVTIRQFAPGTEPARLVAVGELDFSIDGDSFQQHALARDQVPVVSIAAIFQKDRLAVLAHPAAGVRRFEDLRGRTVFAADDAGRTLWPWLRTRFGLDQGQLRSAPTVPERLLAEPGPVLLADVVATALARPDVPEPAVLLPADDVYYTYTGTVQAATTRIAGAPELVQRFVDATIEGWYRYLYGDAAAAHRLIMAANPGLHAERLAPARTAIRRHGLIDSSHALIMGIGAMDGGHWVNFWKTTLGRRGHQASDFSRLYTLQFVNQGHGMALKERLLGG